MLLPFQRLCLDLCKKRETKTAKESYKSNFKSKSSASGRIWRCKCTTRGQIGLLKRWIRDGGTLCCGSREFLELLFIEKQRVHKVTFPWSLHSDIHVTQMALAALDHAGRRRRRGTGGSTLLVIPQAALLLDGRSIRRRQRGEAMLAGAAVLAPARDALAHAGLLSENWSAGRQLRI